MRLQGVMIRQRQGVSILRNRRWTLVARGYVQATVRFPEEADQTAPCRMESSRADTGQAPVGRYTRAVHVVRVPAEYPIYLALASCNSAIRILKKMPDVESTGVRLRDYPSSSSSSPSSLSSQEINMMELDPSIMYLGSFSSMTPRESSLRITFLVIIPFHEVLKSWLSLFSLFFW